MNLRPIHLLVPVLGVALALLSPFEKPQLPIKRKKGGPTAAVPTVGKWSDARFLEARMHEACVWVKEATGMDFVKEPTARVATVDEVAGVLRQDMDAAFRRLGAADDAGVAAMSRALAGRVLAVYDPVEQVVHVLPENAKAAAQAARDEGLANDANVLRLVLVRMGVIAVDRQILTDWKEALDAAQTLDAVVCAGAVLEGHAQYETERIARNWARQEPDFPPETFDRLVTLLTAPSPADAPPAEQALAGEAKFALLKGHAFIEAVSKRRRPGLKGVLAKPPTDRQAIFDPQGYLAGFTPAGQIAERVAKEFAILMPSDSGWQVEDAATESTEVEAWMAPLERALWAGEVASFGKGRTWTGSHPDGGVQTRVTLMEFRTGGMASSYVALAKSAAERSGATVAAGAGRDGGLPGFSARRTADGKENRIQMTSEGAFVLAVVSTDAETERERFDDAMEAAAELLAKQQKTRKNRKDK